MKNNQRFMLRYDMNMSAEQQAEILVYSQIVSWKWSKDDPEVTALDFDKMLKEAKAKGATKLHLRINSPGGNVYQAVAMRAMLLNSGFEELTATIEGLCASAATLLCVPGMHVAIAAGSSFMIHNPVCGIYGTSADMRQEADRLEKMEADFHAIYANRTGKTEDEIKAMMDKETWMTAKEAVEAGFCDTLLEGDQAAACVTEEQMNAMKSIYNNTPEMAVQQPNPNVSNTGTESTAAPVTENTSDPKEEIEMDLKGITMEQLRQENPDLLNAAIAEERQRVQDIDDLTLPGYEQMAAEAKRNGTSAMDFQKQIVKAQREKGTAFMQQRQEETQPAAQVKGSDPAQADKTDKAEMDAFLKEVAMYAGQVKENDGGMY